MHKLGSRLIRVITPDRKVLYFNTSTLSSLRMFWIFRNFSTLDDRVLSERQLELIRKICYQVQSEVPKGSLDISRLIGTLELSSTARNMNWGRQSEFQVAPRAFDNIASRRLPRTLAPNAIALAAFLLFAAIVVADQQVRSRLASFVSRPAAVPAATLPQDKTTALRAEENSVEHDAEAADVADAATASRPQMQLASLKQSTAISLPVRGDSLRSVAPPGFKKIKLQRSLAADALPASGPPQTRPILNSFSPVLRDVRIVLRAIVAPDGRVTRVHIEDPPSLAEENAQLVREAMRAVGSWRYSPHDTGSDAESRILFQFSPDVVTVSFLDPHRDQRVP
jgi:hypothetical protein